MYKYIISTKLIILFSFSYPTIKLHPFLKFTYNFRERVNKTTCTERTVDTEGGTVATPHPQVYHLLQCLPPPHSRWTIWVTWATWAIWATWTRNLLWCLTAGQQISPSSNTVSRFVPTWNSYSCQVFVL